MTTTPDFRTQCASLLAAIQLYTGLNPAASEMSSAEVTEKLMEAMAATVAALVTTPPEPTNEEIAAAIQKGADQEFYATVEALAEYCDCGVELTDSDAREVLYELRRPHIALDYWGNEKHKSVSEG